MYVKNEIEFTKISNLKKNEKMQKNK